MSIMGKTQGAAVRMYQITYIMGFCLGSILYLSVNWLSPPTGLGIAEDFDHESNVVEGVAVSRGSESDGKNPIVETNSSDKLKAEGFDI
jgi:hypothetical protein